MPATLQYAQQTFRRPDFGDTITVDTIVTHGKDDKGKKVQLTRPIYHIKYDTKDKKPFTTYIEEINRMVSFGRWVKI
jgi:hypothetical protein